MIQYMLEMSYCWACFYLLYYALFSRLTFFSLNRWYLLFALVAGLIIPFLELPTTGYFDQLEQINIGIQSFSLDVVTIMSGDQSANKPNFLFNFYTIYWLGVAFMLGRLLLGLTQLVQLYTSGKILEQSNYKEIRTTDHHSPFSFFNYLFISQHYQLAEEDRVQITQHELAHIHGWHSIDVLISEVVIAFFWFNPFVYWFKRSIQDTHEFIADENVLHLNTPHQYGQLLIRQAQSGLYFALGNHFFQPQLKKRLLMMTKTRNKPNARLRYLMVLPIALLLCFAFTDRYNFSALMHNGIDSFSSTSTTPAVFAGCETIADIDERLACSNQKLTAFIQDHLTYPVEAKANNINGKVIIGFTIDQTGQIKNAEILEDLGYGCGEAALKVVNSMPKWTPGTEGDQVVSVDYKIPFQFNLPAKVAELPTSKDTSKVYREVDQMPLFPGCSEADYPDSDERFNCSNMEMLQFIYTNIKYPEAARKLGLEGTVVSSFTVEKDGSISDLKIVRHVHTALSEEVLRVVGEMNTQEIRWTPGLKDGKDVRVQMMLPIKFKLGEEDKKEAPPKLAVKKMAVSPNPNKGQFNLQFEAPESETELRVIDAKGQVVYNKIIPASSTLYQLDVNLGNIGAGVFNIQLQQGGAIHSQAFVIQ